MRSRSGMGKTQVSRIFKISRNTIDLWLKKREETGDYRAEVGYRAEDTILKSLT